jgi:hypothetical protein
MQSALLDVIVVVAVMPKSPSSPIPGIRQTRTLDTPVDMFIINAVFNVALSPSARRRSRDRYGMSCSSHLKSLS